MKTISFFLGFVLSSVATSRADLLLNEPFAYADGPLVGAIGSPWLHHSGSVTGEVDVAAQRLFLTQKEGEDVSAPLAGAPYSATNPATLYASFTLSFRALPTKAGAYFAHFKDAGSGFRARLFASTNTAAPGCFRLSIANGASDPTASAPVSRDLNLNTNYVVVMRYDVTTCTSALWLNPVSESDPAALAGDATSTNSITSFAFRQSLSSGSGMGELFVQNLRVGTTFSDVVPGTSSPAPFSLVAVWLDGALQCSLAGQGGRSYAIETSDDLINWTPLEGLTDVNGTIVFTENPPAGTTTRLYRARLLE